MGRVGQIQWYREIALKFDWTINLGEMIAAFVLLFGFFSAHMQNIRELQEIKTKLAVMFVWFEENVMRKNGRRDD
jgi:hypothetical protein